jgi:hypothetical protein
MGAVKVQWELDSGWRQLVECGIHGRKLPFVNIPVDGGVVANRVREGWS